MKRTKRFLFAALAMAMVFCYIPGISFAETKVVDTANAQSPAFTDMTGDGTTEALLNAVANGLMKGSKGADGLEIKPSETLTRAEMAAVVNRAFGATQTSTLRGVRDVDSGSWYAEDIARAIYMGTMNLDTFMRPNDKITKQEACTILARAFKIEASDSTHAALNIFADRSNIDPCAEASICALVEVGAVSGVAGYFNPADEIKRIDFAKIMNKLVNQYINKAETVTEIVASGNVMINTPGVTLKNVTINGDLIIGDGVGSGEITLDSVKVTGKVIVRGGGINSIIITGNSSVGSVVVAKVDGNVRVAVEGNATITTVIVTVEDAKLSIAQGATVSTVDVAQSASGAMIEVVGTVTALINKAPKTHVAIAGTVETIEIAKTADATTLDIAKGAAIDKVDTSVNITTSGVGKARATTGTGTLTNKGGISTTTSSSRRHGGSNASGAVASATPITGTTIAGITAPVTGETPVATATETSEYIAAVTWNTDSAIFSEGTVYIATITLTPKDGYTLTGISLNQFKVEGATTVTNFADTGVVTAVFPATELVDHIGAYVKYGEHIDATHLKVVFNETLDETSAEIASNYTLESTFGLSGQPSEAVLGGANNNEVTLTVSDMSEMIDMSSIYRQVLVRVVNVLDLAGNPVDVHHNRAVFELDDIGARVLSVEYVDETQIKVVFDEPLDAASAEIVSNYTLGGTFGLTGNPSEAILGGDNNDEVMLTVSDMNSMKDGQTVSVTVANVLDLKGNPITSGKNSATFGVGDYIGAYVEAGEYVDKTHLKVVFNEPLDPTSAEIASNYTLKSTFGLSGHPIEAVLSGANNNEVTLTVNEMDPDFDAEILVIVSKVLDLAGNPVDEDHDRAEFTID